MTSEEKKTLIDKMRTQLAEEEKNIIRLAELTKPIPPENSIGRISRMDAINNRGVHEAALRQAKVRYKNLEVAIKQVHAKEFGICAKCKKPIPLPRLMYMPESNTCVNCAS